MKKKSQINGAILGLLLFLATSPVLVNAIPEYLYLTVRGDSARELDPYVTQTDVQSPKKLEKDYVASPRNYKTFNSENMMDIE